MAVQGRMTPLSSRATAFSVAALMASASGSKRQEVTATRNHTQSAFRSPQASGPYQSTTTSSPARNVSEDETHYEDQSIRLECGKVQVFLQESSLWRQFYALGTEMIVTKAGRRMFPVLKVDILGLEPQKTYSLMLDVVLVEHKRYKYAYHDSRWLIAGKADPPPVAPPSVYVHPESPASGHHWMKQTVVFDKVKLTNSETSREGQLVLNSMHKYRPRLRIVEVQDGEKEAEEAFQFSVPETEFIAVTAYQNQQITKLKIDCNPFAKGFRESRATARFAVDSCLEAFYAYHRHAKTERGDNLKSVEAHYTSAEATSPVPDHIMSHCRWLPGDTPRFNPFVSVLAQPFGTETPVNDAAVNVQRQDICSNLNWRTRCHTAFTQTPRFHPVRYGCQHPALKTFSKLDVPTDRAPYYVRCCSPHSAPSIAKASSASNQVACLNALTSREVRWARKPITSYSYSMGFHSVERPIPYNRPRLKNHQRRQSRNSCDNIQKNEDRP
ncbi:T-box transcription factor TBX20-like [Corticium candelabrum]|uniref:T-box transcription factor TBX20-like n=1 Tax=Corticium candelabrum TaxID=121492 RepID=UPI002E260F6E|nr:T-box transcription factor TBX20-like [Corticium candelabrum]